MTALRTMSRTGDPETSKDAAVSMEEAAATHTGKILAKLREVYPYALTPEELGDATGLGHVPVQRRLATLRRFGLIHRPGGRRKNKSGRSAMIWQAVIEVEGPRQAALNFGTGE